MARVYSWEVSKNPTKYAYIVNPKDTNKVYIGSEPLTGNNLEKVKKWTTDCTDEEYETQFQKMVTLCAEKGFNVEFETASAYMNVDAPCDNLRGPAGRGIDHIALHSKDNVTRISKYIIYYDDGTTDAFEIQNGIDGKNGIDGTPGAQGDSGVSSKLVMIYTSGKDDYGNTFTPERPTGGSYNFAQSKFTDCPDGWFTSDTNENNERLTPPIWMSSRVFSSTVESTDKEWSQPVQITGEKGEAGADGVTTEFIYYLHDNEPSVENLPSLNEAGYVPPIETGWTASPTGVDEDHLTEWCSLRKINSKTNEWGPWEKPFIWSKYGVNGQDGDGVQYIYLKNAGAIVDNPTPSDYQTNQDYQNKDIEWVPQAGITYTNIDGKNVCYTALEEVEGDITPAGVWSDNPSDLTGKYHSQWVSSRKYRKNQTSGKMEWGAFSAPALWARFGQDGKNATSIRKLYALSTSTSNPPQLPGDSTTTGDWGTGFPIDYQVGVNVVWGTEAEIWAHNSEFVKSYKIVSGIDADGNVVPPTDVTTTNFKDVDSIPDEEVAGYKYLRFNGNYYEWTGGWCQPYLVTGLKGESGYAPNYTIYVFAYGYTNYPPTAPTGNDPEAPGTSTDELNSIITWMDFPNTSGGRIDGAINEVNGEKQRWYQCVGHVYGHNNEVYEWGKVVPCSGQDGAQGGKGDYMEVRFGITEDTTKPLLIEFDDYDNVYREPQLFNEKGEQMGWYATDTELPDIPLGGTMWQIWALIDGATDTVKENAGRYWNGPKRVSGEKGEQGIQGPTGMRGVTGIPGAKSIQMYCLGTYGKNENSECYWDGGDGYFGSKNWKNNVLQNKMDGWFIAKEMPYSDPLTAYNKDGLIHLAKQPANKGRVVKLTETIETNVGPSGSESSFTQTTYTYWLINSDSTYTQLTQTLISDEDFDVYVWCIQGNEKWEVGVHKKYVNITKYDEAGDVIIPEGANSDNTIELSYVPSKQQELYEYVVCDGKYYEWREINGDEVEHRLVGIEWGSPFKLQGTNGLRGLQGTRGQVVYPMGVYNQEEVYITTEDKAPYVYDSNDGMYYVYDNTVIPWVGVLPGYDPETKEQGDLYKTIMVHPEDVSNNFKPVTEDPTKKHEEDTECKYLYYDNKYYIWNGSGYSMASRYKYSIDGSGNEGTWMTSQHGDSPANNYANAINSYNKPSWVRFESFKALYTSIGIIENGLVGSAVFNNEFMFSQQGYAQDGKTITNYAVVSGKDTSYGFLSGYEYDERGEYKNGVPTGRHWKYKGKKDAFIDNAAVNPYEKDEDDKYIHTFLPNVCINFATGQMWLSTGKIRFGSWDDRNVSTLEEVENEIKIATNLLRDAIKDSNSDLQDQIDKSANTYYQANDPSKDWQTTDNTALTTYAPERIGDMWFNTSKHKSYIFAQTTGGVPQVIKNNGTYLDSTNSTLKNAGYYWVESDVPESVYNRINSRSKIFIQKPTTPYYVGDLWFLESDSYKTEKFYNNETGMNKGTCMVCLVSRTSGNCDYTEWGKRDKYADEADVQNAQEELDKMTVQLNNWADDTLISPVERLALKDEYNTVVAEYESILNQAKTCKLENSTEYSEYTEAYSAADRTFKYYTETAKPVSGTDCIKILTTGDYAYSNLKIYYEKRQLLLQKISDTLNTNTTEGLKSVRSEFAVADDAIKATVTALKKDVEGQITAIQNSIVTDEKISGLISQALIDGEVVTKGEIATFITEGEAGELISNATISADKVSIDGSEVNINDIMTVDDKVVTISNANIENCSITDVTINGSLCSPFVLDDDTDNVDTTHHDNFAIYTNSNDLQFGTFSKNLKWDKTQSGRKVSIVNHKWNGTLSNGRVTLNAPSNFFKFSKMEDWARADSPYSGCSLTYYRTTTFNYNDGTSENVEAEKTTSLPKNYFEEYRMSSPGAKHENFLEFTIPAGYYNSYTFYIQTTQTSTSTTPEKFNYYAYAVMTSEKGSSTICLVYPHDKFYRLVFNNLNYKEVKITIRATRNSAGTDTYLTRVILPKSNNYNAKYFYENGLQKTSISISRELVNLIGYGDSSQFYGWLVSNRSDIETKYRYGQDMKVMAWGRIARSNKNWDAANSYVCTYDKTPATLAYCVNSKGKVEEGKYQIAFDSSWNNTIDDCMLFTNGYGLVYDSSSAPCKATWMPFRSSGNNVGITKGFEIWVSDDASLNDGSFYFLVVNSNLLSKFLDA